MTDEQGNDYATFDSEEIGVEGMSDNGTKAATVKNDRDKQRKLDLVRAGRCRQCNRPRKDSPSASRCKRCLAVNRRRQHAIDVARGHTTTD